MTTVTVDVPANLWVTSNSHLHWRVKARRVRALRRLAHMLAGAFAYLLWREWRQ